MSNKSLLLHIGYHKTGSTFLQKLVFANQKCGFSSPWVRPDYFEKLILVNPFTFESSKVRSFFEPGVLEAWKNYLVPVISEEALSGNIYQGEYNSKLIADRLKTTFPEGKVLIVIREQSDMILSVYKHRVRSDLTVSIQEFLKQPEAKTGFNPLFRLEYLEYHWLVEYYQKQFGRDNVLVLPYEMLKYECSSFLEKISTFTGTKIPQELCQEVVNPGYSALTLGLKRWSNMLAPKTTQPNDTWYQKINNSVFYHINNLIPQSIGKNFESKLDSYVKQTIEGHYQKSNQITAKLIELDLQVYGYQM